MREEIKFQIKNTAYNSERQSKTNSQLVNQLYLLNLLIKIESTEQRRLIIKTNILLPGGNKQFEHLLANGINSGKNALIIGSGCELIALQLIEHFREVTVIVNDYELLMQYKININDEEKIKTKMMDYVHTDFKQDYFDLIYAQASLSVPERKDIIKEIKRMLIKDGIFCIGEIVSLKEPVPTFVKDNWARSGLEPLPSSEISNYFESRSFRIISESDLSNTLKDFYQKIKYKLSKSTKEEKDESKKLYAAMKHECDVYLKLGGEKYIGYKSLIMRKAN